MGKKKSAKKAQPADDDDFDALLDEFGTNTPPLAPPSEEEKPPAAPQPAARNEDSGKTLSAADQALKDLGLLDDDEPVKEKVRSSVITLANAVQQATFQYNKVCGRR